MGARSARAWCDGCADRWSGPRPEYRSGQIGRQAVCRRLRDLSSQPTRSCQGPLQTDALFVLAKALREQFDFGLGAQLLSGVRRWRKARQIAIRRGEAVVSRGSQVTVLNASTRVGAGTLEHDPEKWEPVFPRDKREAFARRSCSNKKIERDDDSKKSHLALGRRDARPNRAMRHWAVSFATPAISNAPRHQPHHHAHHNDRERKLHPDRSTNAAQDHL